LDKDIIPLSLQDTSEKVNLVTSSQNVSAKSTTDPAVSVDSPPKASLTSEDTSIAVPPLPKERITRTRSITASVNSAANNNIEDVPVQVAITTPSRRSRTESSNGASRHRNKSGNDVKSTPTETAGSSNSHEFASIDSSKPLSREERKLQSVLKLIERMENNQRKKESRQTQKKDKTKDPSIKDDEQDDENHSDSSVQAPISKSVKFAPLNSNSSQVKRKGRRRGRSGSHSGAGNRATSPRKPQLISQRSSGSGGDMRSTSTESDVNSADESKIPTDSGISVPDAGDSNFRLPKTKKLMMTEWYRSNSPTPSSSPSGTAESSNLIPQQYMRRTLTSPSNALTANVTPSFNANASNTSLDNASAKKRWLRQAISEETDASSPNSRPLSPLAPGDCVAPLKKRRFARSSISSEISNTPPSTPTNNVDGHYSEPEHDLEHEELTISATFEGGNNTRTQNRIISVSEISSAEDEDMDNNDVENLENRGIENKMESTVESSESVVETPIQDETLIQKESIEELVMDLPESTKVPKEATKSEKTSVEDDVEFPKPAKPHKSKKEKSSGGKKKRKHHHHHHHSKKKKEDKGNTKKREGHSDDVIHEQITLLSTSTPLTEEKRTVLETGIICDSVVSEKMSSPISRSPIRKSRWDQVEAKDPVVNAAGSSPVKGTSLAEPIILDYVRDKSISQLKLNFNSSTEISKSTLMSKLARTAAVDVSLRETKPASANTPITKNPLIADSTTSESPESVPGDNLCVESQSAKLHADVSQEYNVSTPTKRKVH